MAIVPWYNFSWQYRVKITSDNTKVSSANDNLYVDLSDLPSSFFSNVRSDGGDIRVTKSDGVTEVAREVVTIDTGGSTGELHFDSTGLSTSSDTEWYIYYGNASATDYAPSDTYGAENVWNSNFLLVYHMQQDPSGTAPQMIDSTSNGNDGTTSGTMTSGDLVTSKIEKGIDFDGTDDSIDTGAALFSTSNNAAPYTISCWVNTTATNDGGIVTQYSDSAPVDRFGFRLNSGKIAWWKGGTFLASSTTSVNTGANVFVAGTKSSGQTVQMYVNGAANGSSGTDSDDFDTANVAIANFDPGVAQYDGIIDEIRISDVQRSANWLLTEYNNQNSPSTFWTIGSQEDVFIPQIIIS